ncbi:MAG: TIGR03936 family radical SAM-associated protein, partial [Sporichthyaceae bacterium]
ATLRVVVRHCVPAVRPDDVLTGLARVADLTPPQSPRVTRLAQGPLGADPREVHDPLAPEATLPGSVEHSPAVDGMSSALPRTALPL